MSSENAAVANVAAKPPQRVIGLDVVRGLLMAYVIIVIHGIYWLRLAPLPHSSALLFEMPLIFMVSGAAYYYGQVAWTQSLAGGARNYFNYLVSRSVRILAPYFAYALVCALIVIYLRGHDASDTLRHWLDPYRIGGPHNWLFLNWHLWFITPFLGVTILLPLLARLPIFGRVPLWAWAVIGSLIMLATDLLPLEPMRLPQMIVFYSLWALFGFGLARAPSRFSKRDLIVVLVLALAALGAALIVLDEQTTPDMQANKFPPNAVFFLFSCAWVSAFLIAAKFISESTIEKLAANRFLKPFIRSGYSIYLWQGVGYTAAFWAGTRWGVNIWLIWAAAIVLTVVLGLIASPLERIRVRLTPAR